MGNDDNSLNLLMKKYELLINFYNKQHELVEKRRNFFG